MGIEKIGRGLILIQAERLAMYSVFKALPDHTVEKVKMRERQFYEFG